MRTSVLQYPATTDAAENRRLLRAAATTAARARPDVMVAPEAAMHDFGAPDLPLGPVAEDLDGPFVQTVAEVADETGAYVVAGMFERSDDPDRPYNTVVVCKPGAGVVANYRKIHLYDSFGYRESDRLRAADPVAVTFPVEDLTVGVMTCYDLRFPEMSRLLVDAGADVLAVPAAWVRGPLKEDHWATLLRARAIENTVFVAGAAQNGKIAAGCSMIVDPMGVVLASLGEADGYASADLDRTRLDEVRGFNPSLANRRDLSAARGFDAR